MNWQSSVRKRKTNQMRVVFQKQMQLSFQTEGVISYCATGSLNGTVKEGVYTPAP